MNKPKVGFKEEISDLFPPAAFEDFEYLKKGKVFEYEGGIVIKVTRVDRKNKRAWGEHIELVNHNKGFSHYGHNLDSTEEAIKQYGVPYCTDCETPVSEMASNEGHKKAQDREDRTLSDGTIIE